MQQYVKSLVAVLEFPAWGQPGISHVVMKVGDEGGYHHFYVTDAGRNHITTVQTIADNI